MADLSSLPEIGDRLLTIDEDRFREVVDLMGQLGEHPEVVQAFSAIRPRLTIIRPRRVPTWKRLFCEPFEDLFAVETDRMDRSLINCLWPHVEAAIGSADLRAMTRALRSEKDQKQTIRAFWLRAAEATGNIASHLAAGAKFADLGPHEHANRDAIIADIVISLLIAPQLADLKQVLSPKPVHRLHEDHLEGLQNLARRVNRAHADAMPLFLRLAAARLADPAMMLGSILAIDLPAITHSRDDMFHSLGETVVSQMEERAIDLINRLEAASPKNQSAENAASTRLHVTEDAIGLIQHLESARHAMEVGRDLRFDRRLKSMRERMRVLVREQVLSGIGEDILAGSAASRGTCTTPAAKAEKFRQVLAAEENARALRKCAAVADQLGLRDEVAEMSNATTQRLVTTATRCLRPEEGAPDHSGGYAAIRMIELIVGSVEANRILEEIRRPELF